MASHPEDRHPMLDQLSQLKPAAPEAPKYVKKIDKQGRAYATGKRKDAVARVWLKRGAGKIVVVSSDAGRVGSLGESVYSGAKGGATSTCC